MEVDLQKQGLKLLFISFIAFLFLGGVFFYQYSKFSDGKLHVIFCNVGQGDGIFIRTPAGADILIDGGPDDSILSCLSNHMPFWDKDLEVIILTHPHADHLTGLITIAKRYDIKSFYTEKLSSNSQIYKELIKELEEKKVTRRFLSKGDKLNLNDGVKFKTLWPLNNPGGRQIDEKDLDLNGLSVIELLTYKNFKVLLTGDAGVTVEKQLEETLEHVNILKVPHHGSKTGINKDFLSLIKPNAAVISVGANNRYGHPAALTLDLLKNAGIKTLRTDNNGEVEAVSNGEEWSLISERGE